MSGAAGLEASLETLYTIPATSRTHTAPATSQALRSDEPRPASDGLTAAMAEAGLGRELAWQWAQARRARLAPHPLQKLPEAGVPQAGQVAEGGVVMGGEA